jgi:hypothetical protein
MGAGSHYDVIIIGTGAGGGTLARHLAPSGKRILLLERGGFLPREKQNWDVEEVFVKNRYVSRDPWYDRDGQHYTRAEQLYHVHGRRGADPTEPPASAPYPYPALSHEPRIQDSSTTCEGPATIPSRRQRLSSWTSRTGTGASASAATLATASPAWCMPRPMRRSSACARRSSTPT